MAPRCDELRQIHPGDTGKFAGVFNGYRDRTCTGHDATGLRTLLANDPRQLARIDIGNRNGVSRFQKIDKDRSDRQLLDAWSCPELPVLTHESCRLHVVAVRSGIADMGIGQCDDLPAIRGIRQDFLVARHCSIEYDLADGLAFGADRSAVEYRSVLQCQYCWRAQVRSSRLPNQIACGQSAYVQMHKSGRTLPSARDFADRPAIRRSLLKASQQRQIQTHFFLSYRLIRSKKRLTVSSHPSALGCACRRQP